MTTSRGLPLLVTFRCGLALLPATGQAQKTATDAKLPDAVRKTFEARFPGAEAHQVDSEEGGVTYAVEMAKGDREGDGPRRPPSSAIRSASRADHPSSIGTSTAPNRGAEVLLRRAP